jgi:hypothetical protein
MGIQKGTGAKSFKEKAFLMYEENDRIIKGLVATCHSFLLFIFSIYDTLQNMVQSHHIILYDEAGVCKWNCWYSII